MTKRTAKILLIVLVSIIAPARVSLGDVPATLSYQGVLTNSDGSPVSTAVYKLDFRIFDNASGTGTPLFFQQIDAFVKDGLYNVILSDNGTYTLSGAFSGATRFMEITIVEEVGPPPVAINAIVLPRQQIASVPYAITALQAQNLTTPPPASVFPAEALILWDKTNDCPPGFTEATEYSGYTIRGADRAGLFPAIPDAAGDVYGQPADDGTQGQNDALSLDQMPVHSHDVFDSGQMTSGTDDADGLDMGADTPVGDEKPEINQATTDAGGDQPHYHPHRTVLFCRKDLP